MSHSRSLVAILCSTLALISCIAAQTWRKEGRGGGRDVCGEGIRHSREEKREGEGVELKMIDGSFRCHVCYVTLSAYIWPPPPLHTHTM